MTLDEEWIDLLLRHRQQKRAVDDAFLEGSGAVADATDRLFAINTRIRSFIEREKFLREKLR